MTQPQSRLVKAWRTQRRTVSAWLRHPVFVTGIVITAVVLGVRQIGGTQPWELLTLDQMLRLRADQTEDPRLLIVAITEADIKAQNRWPISDAVLAQVLAKLQQQQPRTIGLDIYRDVPHEPGHAALLKQLQADNVMGIKLLGTADKDAVSGPPGMPEARVGFSDIVLDPDAVVRRNWLYSHTQTEELYSFSLRLALHYLGNPSLTLRANQGLQIGGTWLPSLQENSGGYEVLDDRGYQVILNYRSDNLPARQVTLTQVLNDQVDPAWIRDKLVLIGTTAPSVKDLFLTPYNLANGKNPEMPGVVVHAHKTSQILSAVLDGRSLIWYAPEPVEALWLAVWALLGGGLGWRLRHPLSLGIVTATGFSGLFAICVATFFQGGWIPFVPAAIAFGGANIAMLTYRMLHDALHDDLTGLPNRALMTNRLQWLISRQHKQRRPKRFVLAKSPTDETSMALLFLGLDNFKTLNDSLGHRIADELLVEISQRIRTCLRSQDQLARVGGDEFAILLNPVRDADEVAHIADLVQKQVKMPFELSGQKIVTTASVGIVLDQPDYTAHPEDLLRDAHTAMNQAKAAGKARYQVFRAGMREQAMTRLQLESDLRRAIERAEFELYYQPVVALATGHIAGFEALLRWHHPQRGFVHPVEFIPVAEETDLIIPIGQWVTREACRQLKAWQELFPQELPLNVSVNLSGRQFAQADLIEQMEQILAETGLDGRSLKLEITESIAMTDVEATIDLLLRFKALDLQLSIDDFGTGYSSLSYLHRFPTDTIKVDRSFVSRMGDIREDAHIVQTIVMLGHNLNMSIVAEGVETAEQLAQLRSLKCEYAQGYFFSRPVPRLKAEELLKANPQW